MGREPATCAGAPGEGGPVPRLLDGLKDQCLAEAERGDGMWRLLAFVFADTSPGSVWLREGFVKWFQDGHALSLERCLHLPTTAAKRRQAIRNYWLLDAASYIEAPNARCAGALLEKELNHFTTRGNWLRWRDDSDPPADAPRMDRAMFYAVKYNKGAGLCARQLERIVGHKFRK